MAAAAVALVASPAPPTLDGEGARMPLPELPLDVRVVWVAGTGALEERGSAVERGGGALVKFGLVVTALSHVSLVWAENKLEKKSSPNCKALLEAKGFL